jgi:hypothetical protein
MLKYETGIYFLTYYLAWFTSKIVEDRPWDLLVMEIEEGERRRGEAKKDEGNSRSMDEGT